MKNASTHLSLLLLLGLVSTFDCLASNGWSVNMGGATYQAQDGTVFQADNGAWGGTPGKIEAIKGTGEPTVFQTYRQGAAAISQAVALGLYDVTLFFAEPEEFTAGSRVFDVYIESKLAVDDLDVMVARDGRSHSALTVTIPRVKVTDGKLDIVFKASKGEAILSALSVVPHENGVAGKLIWSDEFDGTALDLDKWNIDEWDARVVNDEDQAYTAKTRNLRVHDGHLVLEAHKEDYRNANYTSGRIHSKGKGDFLYGRIEVRAKLPSGQGTWPAIWMLPSDPFKYATLCQKGEKWQGNPNCDAWPNSGEIDIMEHVGYEMNHVHGTVHTKAYYWVNAEQRKGRILLDDVAQNFHVYALEWTPDSILMFVDDTHYFTYPRETADWQAWPFDQPFHLIMNLAVGGMWGRAGGPIDDSIFPQQLTVDYVRVYELDSDR